MGHFAPTTILHNSKKLRFSQGGSLGFEHNEYYTKDLLDAGVPSVINSAAGIQSKPYVTTIGGISIIDLEKTHKLLEGLPRRRSFPRAKTYFLGTKKQAGNRAPRTLAKCLSA